MNKIAGGSFKWGRGGVVHKNDREFCFAGNIDILTLRESHFKSIIERMWDAFHKIMEKIISSWSGCHPESICFPIREGGFINPPLQASQILEY